MTLLPSPINQPTFLEWRREYQLLSRALSSLVGDIINASGNTARVPRGLCGNWPRIIPLIIGKQNAAVFPDPV
ncbi:hypothetical protein HanXRQr2_Chr02g0079291 [Helianthus annuus]|uniref:Uncharacterized protein n=1 Tax=Helianthus annuus TaxID=4232 RepID=A0A9K3JQK3_HELAN|nr:hypothetical protein HanXRQr2_Chr02g0079291 [Helianthus annuus]